MVPHTHPIPLLARNGSRTVWTVTDILMGGTITHLKCQYGHLFAVQGAVPIHSPDCRDNTVNALNLQTLTNQGVRSKTLMYCIVRHRDGTVPPLDMIQKLGIMLGNLTHDTMVKSLQECTEWIGLYATRLAPLDTNWVFARTVAVIY